MEPEGEPKKHEIDHHVDTTATANVAGGETETPRPITGSGKSAMATDADTQQEQQGEQGPEDHGIQHDSMVTVRLSEPSLVPSPPPALRVDTNVVSGSLKRRRSAVYVKRSDAEERDDIMAAGGATPTVKDDDSAASITTPSRTDSIAAEQMSPIVIEAPMSLRQELEDSDEQEDDDGVQTPGEGSSDDDDDDANAPAWARMQETEDEAGKGMGKDVDNVSTLPASLESSLKGGLSRR